MSAFRKLLSGGHVVAYYPALARAAGGVAHALFLQQLAHHEGVEGDKDGWVHLTQEQIKDELVLSGEVQKRIRTALVEKEFIEEAYIGGGRRLCYRVLWDNVEAALRNQANPDFENRGSRESKSGKPGEPNKERTKELVKGANAPLSGDRKAGARKPKKAPTNTQYLMDQIYEAMKAERMTLDSGEYAYNLGRVKDMLEKDEPSGRELEHLPEACVEYFDWYGKLDVRKALRRHRQQQRREQRQTDQESAGERERWRAPQAAVEAVRNHSELSRYTELLKRWDPTTTEIPQGAFLGLGADDTERWKNQARIESVARRAAGVSIVTEEVRDAVDELVEEKKLPPTFEQYLKESEVDPNDLDEAARNVLMDIYDKEKKRQEKDDG